MIARVCARLRDRTGLDTVALSGGVFASDLTRAYSQYQDIALTVFLKRPCFLRLPESKGPAYLAPEESFALKAYLRSCALRNQRSDVVGKSFAATVRGLDCLPSRASTRAMGASS